MFKINGLPYRICTWIYKLILLNALFLITCIPIITIFPATAAAFGIGRQWVKKNEPHIFSTYFRLFKENFKQSMIIGGIITLAGFILYGDFYLINFISSNLRILSLVFFCTIGLIYCMALLTVFPLMVNGFYTNKQLLLNAIKVGIYRFPLTIVNLVCILIFFYLSLRFTFILVFFFSSISILLTYWINEQKFQRILTEQITKANET